MVPCTTRFGDTYLDLDDKEKERVSEILEELRFIFSADSVSLVREINCRFPVDYTIEITGSPANCSFIVSKSDQLKCIRCIRHI